MDLWQRPLQWLRSPLRIAVLAIVLPAQAHSSPVACEKLYAQAAQIQTKQDYPQAIEHYEKALALECSNQGDIVHQIGELHFKQQNYAEAVTHYQQAITLKSAQADEALALSYYRLGLAYQWQGEYAAAEDAYQQALTIREQQHPKDSPYIGQSLNALGMLYNTTGDYAKAEPLLKQAVEIMRTTWGEEHPRLANYLNNLGLLYNKMNKYAEAEPLLQQALTIRETALGDEHPNVATSLNNLALLYSHLSHYERAEPLYQRALAIREQHLGPTHPRVANTLHSLAFLYQSQGKVMAAVELYERALAIKQARLGEQHPQVASILNNLAALQNIIGNKAQAAQLHEDALNIREAALGKDHPKVAISLTNQAVLFQRDGEYAKAEGLFRDALYIAVLSRQPELLWWVLANLSDVLYAQDFLNAAVFLGKLSVNSLQKLRVSLSRLDKSLQKSFLRDRARIYQNLVDILMEQGRLLEAQQVITMLKEEQYFDFVDRDESADIRHTEARYTEIEQVWAQQFATLVTELQTLHSEFKILEDRNDLEAAEAQRFEALERIIVAQEQALKNYVATLKSAGGQHTVTEADQEISTAELTQLQTNLRELGNQAVLLHYFMSDNRLRILLTTDSQQIAREAAVSKTELNRTVLEFHQGLQNPRRPPIKIAQTLYEWIIAPVAADLIAADAKVLMLSLDSTLNYVPIAALHDGEAYLAERYAVVAYNEAAKKNITQAPAKGWRVAGLGLSNAVSGFNPLPMVIDELDAIVRLDEHDERGVMPGVAFLNEQFTADKMLKLLAADYSVMHVASHFVFEPGTDQASYLLLGNGDKLTLAQVREQFDFNRLDLLTLSACDTAMGDVSNGREIEGFAVLAQNQGAKSVLATLWPVNDQSTGDFMQALYEIYVNQEVTKAEAIQQVQQQFIQAAQSAAAAQTAESDAPAYPYFYALPYYWAPFILMGNWL